MNYLRVDLKVCEGCGGLWLRTENTAGVYCRHCKTLLADFPEPRKKRKTGPRRKSTHDKAHVAAGTAGGAR